jgi:hypothetical protein
MGEPDWEPWLEALGDFLGELVETQRGAVAVVLFVVALGVGCYLLWG